MITYEYLREDGEVFEFVQSMKDDALTHCPDTGLPVKRLISGGQGRATTILKGGGFHDKEYSPSLDAYKRNQHITTLSHYQKKIDANTQKAREAKAKAGLI